MNVWAVVVNWNGGEENLECLASLLVQGMTADRIAFVDNASTDGSLESVRRRYPALRVVENETNRGYGHGTNQGIELALAEGADAVFLVNNDVVLPEYTLRRLGEVLGNHPEVGIVGPRVLYKGRPDVVWAAGGMLTFRQNLTTLVGHGRRDDGSWSTTRPVDYVPGCAMLVRREVFERAGLLNADYFAYHEDVEFCMDAKAAGFGTLMAGEIIAFHSAGSTTGGGYNARRKYMMGVNTIWFLRKHGTPWRWLRFFVFDVLSLPFVGLVGLFRGRGRGVLAKAIGMLHGARGRKVSSEILETGAGPLW